MSCCVSTAAGLRNTALMQVSWDGFSAQAALGALTPFGSAGHCSHIEVHLCDEISLSETTSLLFCRSISMKTFALKSIVWALHVVLCSLATGKDEIPRLTVLRSHASPLSLRWRLKPGMLGSLGSALPSEHPSVLSPILASSCPQSNSDFEELGTFFSTVAMTRASHCSALAIHTKKNCSEEYSA